MNFSKKIVIYTASLITGLFNFYSFAEQAQVDFSMTDLKSSKQRLFNANRPWKEPQSTFTAINEPDRYAWQLFVALNWPGDENNCQSDKNKRLGEEGLTTWQMWRSREETFLANAKQPKSWNKACKSANFLTPPQGDFSVIADEEVRLNKRIYKYIRKNKLYSLDQQESLAKAGIKNIEFPIGVKEIKAHWVKISEDDKDRYHWITVERDNTTEFYGLSALHISSKDQPTWFWSTFEHIDNEQYWPQVYPSAFRGWQVPSVDSIACPADNLACNELPQGFGLEGTKWQYFRLRGTQIDWVDNRGNPTVLTNSQIEGSFDQQTMSCLTCHALAVKGASGESMPIALLPGTVNDEGLPHGYIGTLDPKLFNDSNNNPVPYVGLDYVWTLRHAQREEEN